MSSVNQTTILGIVIGSAVGSILIGSAINHIWSGYSEEKDNGGNVLPDYDNIFMQKIISTKRGQRCIICHNDHFFDPSSDPNGNICWCDHDEVSHILYINNKYSQKPSGNYSIAAARAGTRRLRKKKSLSNR